MWRRSKKQETEKRPPLVLSAQDGAPWMTFPAPVVDSLRHMAARAIRNDSLPARLSLLSSLEQEGVTYLSRALGTTMAHDLEATVCVVELNWWRPSDEPLTVAASGGIAAVLAGKVALDEAVLSTGLPNLFLLPAGKVAIEERAVLARSSILKETINQLGEQFDYLILDIPAVLAANDAIPLASLGDAACLVALQGVTSVGDVRLALDDIDHLPILGVVMNQVHLATPSILLKYIPQH
ncbi:MAG: CpsD/CapB family tyrosine-protein kinase [Chloroflexi bacterium]|nr:CpsD/CapB family tyrosine-protein kinase [Chloroflexota bacterium]